MRYLTIANYAVVAALWLAILGFYLRYRRIAKEQDPLVATLLGILALDALKSVVENTFFGIVWTRRYGLGFEELGEILARPGFLIVPKLLNTFVAITVLAVVIQHWIPSELRTRRETDAERTKLLGALGTSLSEVERKEERWQLAVRATSDGIFDLDVETGNLWVSETYGETLGYAPGELRAETRAELLATVHADDRARFAAFLDAAIDTPEAPAEIEVRQHVKQGTDRLVIIRVSAVRDDGQRARRLVGAQSDITERRAAEAALAMQQRTESLGLLASGIAHDFNNLLMIMKVNAAVVGSPGRGEALADLRAAIVRAQDLTARLLAYSGKGKALITEIDLGELAEELVRLLRATLPTQVVIRLERANALGRAFGDAAQLQQVVLNLLRNAIDAMGDNPGTITISTREEAIVAETESLLPIEPGSYVVLTVADTGSGMTEEVRARIFDPLFTTKSTGHGLGLSAMLGILRAHKGGIRVESAPGVGTSMTLLLPLAAAEAPDMATSHRRALIVDDEEAIARSLKRLVGRLGFEVDTVADGEAALAQVATTPYDLVLLDIGLPGSDGRVVLARLREKQPQLPVVLMSGRPLADEVDDARTCHLEKPFSAAALSRCIRNLLGE